MDNNTLQKDILLKDYEMKVNYIEEHIIGIAIKNVSCINLNK